jgi:hypothetical protein
MIFVMRHFTSDEPHPESLGVRMVDNSRDKSPVDDATGIRLIDDVGVGASSN